MDFFLAEHPKEGRGYLEGFINSNSLNFKFHWMFFFGDGMGGSLKEDGVFVVPRVQLLC